MSLFSPRKKRVLFRLAAVLLAALLGLCLTEGALRLLSPVHMVFLQQGLIRPSLDPALRYEPDPAWPGHEPDGLRSLGMPEKKAAGGGTIIVLGDSIAYGLGLAPRESAAAAMQRYIDTCPSAEDRRVKNLGVPGYGIEQVIARLRQKGLALHPDKAVYLYCLNDIFMDAGRVGNLLLANTKSLILPEGMARGRFGRRILGLQMSNRLILLYQKLRYYGADKDAGKIPQGIAEKASPRAVAAIREFLATSGNESLKRMQWGNIEHAYYPSYYYNEQNLLKLNACLARYSGLCKENGIAPSLFIVPIFCTDPGREYVFADIHRIVARLAEQNGIAAADLADLEKSYGADGIAQEDCSHPTAYGNELIARNVLSALGLGQCLGPAAP